MKEIRDHDIQKPLRLSVEMRAAVQQTARHKKKAPPPFSIRFTFEERARLETAAAGIAGEYVRVEFADAVRDIDAPRLAEAYQKVLTEVLPYHRTRYREYLSENALDAIVFPTVPMAPILIGDNVTTLMNGGPKPIWHTFRNSLPATFYGAPGISVPFARTLGGLPLGLEFDGAPGADRELLNVAAAWARTST